MFHISNSADEDAWRKHSHAVNFINDARKDPYGVENHVLTADAGYNTSIISCSLLGVPIYIVIAISDIQAGSVRNHKHRCSR